MRKKVLPRLLIIATKMKMTDVTAPYPIMAKATVLLFINFFSFISYSPLKMSHLPLLTNIGVHKTVENK